MIPAFRVLSIAPMALLSGLAHALGAPQQDLGGSVFQLVFGLGIVIALLVASLWLLKRVSAPRGEAAGLMRVIAATAVGARERVVVLEIGGAWLVLGVAPGRVTSLAEIPRGSLPPEAAQGQTKEFAGWLKQVIDRRDAR